MQVIRDFGLDIHYTANWSGEVWVSWALPSAGDSEKDTLRLDGTWWCTWKLPASDLIRGNIKRHLPHPPVEIVARAVALVARAWASQQITSLLEQQL
jgi:hypothetical protein